MSGATPTTITLRPEITAVFARLTVMQPWERAVAAERLRTELMAARVACTELRRDAAIEMRASGMTWQMIADLLGMSRQKAHELGRAAPIGRAAPLAG